ncbi:MAG: hypothetical protein WBX07_06460, partial [Rhodoplanes sp.]
AARRIGAAGRPQSEDLGAEAVVPRFEATILFGLGELVGPIRSSMRLISVRIACSLSSAISAGRLMVLLLVNATRILSYGHRPSKASRRKW